MKTLLQHIKDINAKSQKWMNENPGSWAGMVTEDIQHWNDQGIFTVEDYERSNLEISVYEMHKDAYGVKGRHYNFDAMSNKELEDELEHLCKVANAEREAEEQAEKAAYYSFLKQIVKNKKMGAVDTKTAIKWILQSEKLDKEYDPCYICYCLGLSYDKQDIFKPYTMKEAA